MKSPLSEEDWLMTVRSDLQRALERGGERFATSDMIAMLSNRIDSLSRIGTGEQRALDALVMLAGRLGAWADTCMESGGAYWRARASGFRSAAEEVRRATESLRQLDS